MRSNTPNTDCLGRYVDDRWPDIATDFVEVHQDISIEDWQTDY